MHALSFKLIKDGKAIISRSRSTSSDRQPGTPFAKIQYFVTLVYRGGEVVVDRFFGRDLPPEGLLKQEPQGWFARPRH